MNLGKTGAKLDIAKGPMLVSKKCRCMMTSLGSDDDDSHLKIPTLQMTQKCQRSSIYQQAIIYEQAIKIAEKKEFVN